MTSFYLKLIAAVSMFIDHMGFILFPQYTVLRIIGRLAFPIYAYCIAEGFRYTKNRKRYFFQIFALGALCQVVYTVVMRDAYIGILPVFSIAILLMALQERMLAERAHGGWRYTVLYILAVFAVFLLTCVCEVDYGFFGVMLPVVTARFPDKPRRLMMFSVDLVLLAVFSHLSGSTTQIFSLFALIPLLLYNGKPGKYRLKYFFYIFYPAHLVLLYVVDYLFF